MSDKIRSSIEVFLGLILVFGYLWLIYPLYSLWIKVLGIIPVLLFFVYADFVKHRNLKDMGLRLDNWRDSCKILAVFTGVAMPVLYLVWQSFFPVNNLFYQSSAFWKKLFSYPFWALFQQYIFLAFFFRRYRTIFAPRIPVAVFFSALTFAMIHIPNPSLFVLCFAGGIVWAIVYDKSPNLFTIAISQAAFGVFVSSILLVYQVVGPNADIGRWSSDMNQVNVYGYIDTIDHQNPYKDSKILEVAVDRAKGEITVEGWVGGAKSRIEKISMSLGGRQFSVRYGEKRENVASFFKNPDFLYSGFSAKLPVSDFKPGYYRLILKVYLEGELFYNTPGERIWIRIT